MFPLFIHRSEYGVQFMMVVSSIELPWLLSSHQSGVSEHGPVAAR